ncbi:MAG: phosphate-starvation-inducible PsiE family protein [Synechococcus sp.]
MPSSRRPWPSFLKLVDNGEQIVAKILTVVTAVVIVAALSQLILRVVHDLFSHQPANWLGDGLIKVLGDLLTVLIALEVLQNVTSYLRRHVVQLELVLVTALTAVARKVIVLPAGSENKPQLLIGLGLASIALAGAYWLVIRSHPQGRNNQSSHQ